MEILENHLYSRIEAREYLNISLYYENKLIEYKVLKPVYRNLYKNRQQKPTPFYVGKNLQEIKTKIVKEQGGRKIWLIQ